MQRNSQSQSSDSPKRGLTGLPWWAVGANGLNAVFALWTFGGSPFLLFLDELGLPKSRIGFLLSLFPFAGLLAVAFIPWAARWGYKRVFVTCYGTRKLVMAQMLWLPLLLLHFGPTATLWFLTVLVAVFAILRALAETAYYPWSREFVPNELRGRFFAINTISSTVMACLALAIASRVIARGEGIERFLWLIGVGVIIGLIGVSLMARVRGGQPNAANALQWNAVIATLRERNFCRFLAATGCCSVGAALQMAFLPLFVRDEIGVRADAVVLLDTATLLGGVASSFIWGWAADRFGSRPTLMPALTLTMIATGGWLIAPHHASSGMVWAGVIYVLAGIGGTGVALSAQRLFFVGVIPPERNAEYNAVHYAWLGLIMGVSPLVAGNFLSKPRQLEFAGASVDGYAIIFLTSLAFFAVGIWLYRGVRPDSPTTTRQVFLMAWRNIRAALMPRM